MVLLFSKCLRNNQKISQKFNYHIEVTRKLKIKS